MTSIITPHQKLLLEFVNPVLFCGVAVAVPPRPFDDVFGHVLLSIVGMGVLQYCRQE